MSKARIPITKSQWARASEILGNLGILSAATIAIPYIFDKPNALLAIRGIVITASLWYFSIVFARRY